MTTTTETKPTHVDPSKLAPDFENIEGEIVANEHTFWLGVTVDCPRGQIDVGGLHFPKNEEDIIVNDSGKQVRVPKHGTINKTVTKRHFDELVKVLPRLVIRPNKVRHEDGSGKNTGDPVQRAKGRLIKIPSKKMLADAEASGRALKPYVKRPGDRPASEFMYFIHAPTGHRSPDDRYQTIATVGLEWPAEIQAEEDLMS